MKIWKLNVCITISFRILHLTPMQYTVKYTVLTLWTCGEGGWSAQNALQAGFTAVGIVVGDYGHLNGRWNCIWRVKIYGGLMQCIIQNIVLSGLCTTIIQTEDSLGISANCKWVMYHNNTPLWTVLANGSWIVDSEQPTLHSKSYIS